MPTPTTCTAPGARPRQDTIADIIELWFYYTSYVPVMRDRWLCPTSSPRIERIAWLLILLANSPERLQWPNNRRAATLFARRL